MRAPHKIARPPRIYQLRKVVRASKSNRIERRAPITTEYRRVPCMHECGRTVLRSIGECRKCRRERVHEGKRRILRAGGALPAAVATLQYATYLMRKRLQAARRNARLKAAG